MENILFPIKNTYYKKRERLYPVTDTYMKAEDGFLYPVTNRYFAGEHESVPGDFAFVIELTNSDTFPYTYTFPAVNPGARSPFEMTIDWGDGTAERILSVSGVPTHAYASPGAYTVVIHGYWGGQFYFYGQTKLKEVLRPLPALPAGGGIYTFQHFFSGCASLRSIPHDLFYNNAESGNFFQCFSGCSSLESIPAGLFKNSPANPGVLGFASCFHNCASLKSIPEDLFAAQTEAPELQGVFGGCASLESIPENLFKRNLQVRTFNNCFENCASLAAIPGSLFSNNINVTNFSSCFSGCAALTTIPESLFSNNLKAVGFESCFDGCISLTGNAPNLWDRGNITRYENCFQSCTKLLNYASIPRDWK